MLLLEEAGGAHSLLNFQSAGNTPRFMDANSESYWLVLTAQRSTWTYGSQGPAAWVAHRTGASLELFPMTFVWSGYVCVCYCVAGYMPS